MTNHAWTRSDWATLRRMVRAGAPVEEIADAIGTTVACVYNRKRQAGLVKARNTCLHCRARLTQNTSGGRKKVYCNRRCAAHHRQPLLGVRKFTCTECGKAFKSRQEKKYCTRACSQRAWYKRVKDDPAFKKQRNRNTLRWRQRQAA